MKQNKNDLLKLQKKIWASFFCIIVVSFIEKAINWNLDRLYVNKEFKELLKYDISLCNDFKILKNENETKTNNTWNDKTEKKK